MPPDALFRLAFAPPPRLHPLKHATRDNSPAHSSISTRSALRPLTACRRTVSGSFHPPPGVLFTFPSRYSFTIGRQEYLALEGGPPSFPRDCTGPAVLKHEPTTSAAFVYGALTRSGQTFQTVWLDNGFLTPSPRYRTARRSHDPQHATPVGLTRAGFRLAPVRSPLLGGSRLLSLPRGTKMFQFPRLPPSSEGYRP